jgi:RNA polymerase sigma factor (sigma-70 family)
VPTADQILADHDALVRSFAARYARPGIEADDLEQEARLAILKAAPKYDSAIHGRQIKLYLAAAVRNRLINYCQQQSRQPQGVDQELLEAMAAPVCNGDFWDTLVAVTAQLNPTERLVFTGWIGVNGPPASVPVLQRRHQLTRSVVTRCLSRGLTLLKARLGNEPDLDPVKVNRHVLKAVS